MKILIYGAGVVGSYLAYSLSNAKHDVTMLSRGKRIDEIKSGLKIKHVLQCNETINNVGVIENLKKDDYFDIVFIVMQANQIQDVYQPIIENESCPLIIFIGNNADPKTTHSTIINNSKIERNVLFGFLSVGGRRENGKTISLHLKKPNLHIGTVSEGVGANMREMIDDSFGNIGFSYRWYNNMDGYLKTHIAFIMPLAYLAYLSNFKLHHLFFKGKYLKAAVCAMKEGFDALNKIGVEPVIPEELHTAFKSKFREMFFIKLIILPPFGRLAICDHCRASKPEIDFLEKAFLGWLKDSGIEHKGYQFLLDKLNKKTY